MCVDWASDKFAKYIIHTCGVHVCEFPPLLPPPPPKLDGQYCSFLLLFQRHVALANVSHAQSQYMLTCYNVYTLMLTNHCIRALNVRTDSVCSCVVPANSSFKMFARFQPLLMRMHNEYLNNPDQLFNFIINYYSREPTGNHIYRSGTTNTIWKRAWEYQLNWKWRQD